MDAKVSGILRTGFLLFILSQAYYSVNAQDVTNDLQYRNSFEIEYKPFKSLKMSLIPELRFDESYSLQKYIFESELVYRPLVFLSLDAIYRFTINPREEKDTKYLHRFAFSATAKQEFYRFEPAFRLRYSNYADDEITDEEFLRYKATLSYDIANSKITPVVAVEVFHQLDGFKLHKLRYSVGLNYKLFNNNYINLRYKLDYYKNELRNKHIISIGYKIKL